jgi:tRNA-Thr(GGU) m(6)t(6)A37 methyltransferase TsaA
MADSMISLRPVGVVRSPRVAIRDDFWGDVAAEVELSDDLPPDSLDGLEGFSHAEIFYLFDRVAPENVVAGARHPRNNPAWPKVGIFAQRAKGRPNRLGSTIVRIAGREGRRLHVLGLDAVDGSPVLDIKPVMAEFLPREPVRQPDWSRELMRDYWRPESERSKGEEAALKKGPQKATGAS